MSATEPTEPITKPRPYPLFNILGFAGFFVSIVAGMVTGFYVCEALGVNDNSPGVPILFACFACFSAACFPLSVIAWVRRERYWVITVLGFLLNMGPFLILLGTLVQIFTEFLCIKVFTA